MLKSLNKNERNYTFVKKLGKGVFSHVWLAERYGKKYAIKVARNNKKYKEFIEDEIEFLSFFSDSKYIVNMKEDFIINNNYYCIVFECMGADLLWLIDNYSDNDYFIPKKIILRIVKELTCALIELKNNKIIHTDLKPENILLTKKFKQSIFILKRKEYLQKVKRITKKYNHIQYPLLRELLLYFYCHVKICDLGNACYVDEQYSNNIVTRHYRPPEIILKLPYSYPVDIWSLGCIFYELITGDVLFFPRRNNNMGVNSNHIALMIKTFGEFPSSMIERSTKSKKYFDINNKNKTYLFQYLIGKMESFYEIFYSNWRLSHKDSKFYESLLRPLLKLESSKRITPQEYSLLLTKNI